MYQVLARKWRPQKFTDVVGQEHVVRALTNALTQQRLHHAYLFTGTRGVGKTTIARILAKCLNCETGVTSAPCEQCEACAAINSGRFMDLIEIDAASRTRVEDTRDLLDNVQYLPVNARYKVYIIDEVHMLSGHSFNALLKTLEEPPAHVKFLFATTDPQKLPITVLSRCLQFNLKKLPANYIQQQLEKVLATEKIPFEVLALHKIANAADGSMRDALSLLDQAIAYGGGEVKNLDVSKMLGTVDRIYILRLLERLVGNDTNGVLQIVEELAAQAKDFHDVLDELLNCLHQITVLQMLRDSGSGGRSGQVLDEAQQLLHKLAQDFGPEEVQLYYQIGLIGKRDLPLAPTLQGGFEMIVLRMLAFRPTSLTKSVAAPALMSAVPLPVSTPTPTPIPTLTPASAMTLPPPSAAAVASPALSSAIPATSANATHNLQEIIPQLKVVGATAALLQHCVLTKVSDTEVILLLARNQAPLFNQSHEQRLCKAFSEFYGRALRLVVKIEGSIGGSGGGTIHNGKGIGMGNSVGGAIGDKDYLDVAAAANLLTPAAQQEQKKSMAMQAALQNHNVQNILSTFGAAIIPESVKIEKA
jgi:DNA polymerase III subunit gamma/tau